MKLLTWCIASAAGLLCGMALAQEESLFERLDKNKDGFITTDEVEGERKQLFERLLRNSDKDKDGKLDKAEFASGTKEVSRPAGEGPAGERPRGEQPRGPGDTPAELFKRFDKNGDGKLQKDEVPEQMRQAFDRIDGNGDGVIDSTEFARVAERFTGRRPEGAPGGRPDPRQAEELFTRMDANKDGKLTLDEVPEDKREQVKQMAARGGIEIGNGVTKEEFLKLYAGPGPERRPQPGSPEGRPGFPMGPLFAALDANRDGELSPEEIANAPKALAALDKNGDGKISRDELGPPPERPNGEELLRRLKEADKNGDGKISKEEAPDRLRENFDAADRNGDGQLDEAELKEMLQRILRRQP